jgi:Na+-translocating ferredoxin:NAD+ oxidoreductase RnfC subunit
VVGAGGAGFPTHIKAKSRADIVIANGCECEPLVRSDKYVLETFPEEVLEGVRAMMLATGASRGIIGVRDSQHALIESLRKAVGGGRGIEVAEVKDNYPAGDEHPLVYELTGRAIPQGGIPPQVGVVVSNVGTLRNVRRALEGAPVTTRIVSVCGDVPRPIVVEVPLGSAVRDVLALTGNLAGIETKSVLLSGIMMGEVCEDLGRPVDKRIGAIIALPSTNEVIVRKTLPLEQIVRRAASVCCQCTFCTELCPRHLMGHAITPHKIMRSVGWARVFTPDIAGALYCSGCGLCGIYVCPMLLSPDRISFKVRAEMASRGIRVTQERMPGVEMVRPHRLVPHKRILEKTGTVAYDKDLAFGGLLEPDVVAVPLQQHAGVPAAPAVKVGAAVRTGDLLADVAEDETGARVHASIDGVVTGINHRIVIERR